MTSRNCRSYHPRPDHVEGQSHGVSGGGAGGRDIERWARNLKVDGDLAGSGGGHGADDGKRVRSGVAGVETFDFGFFGGAAAAGAAHNDGDIAGVVVLEEFGLLRGLTGGDDAEEGVVVGGGDDSGVEV